MKFKISVAEKPSHSAPVTCVAWSNAEEVYSAGDDNQILSWSVSNHQSTKVAQLSNELFPTDMQFLPRVSGTLGRHGDLILITSADGKFHIMTRAGRIERSVEAHKGAVLVGQWGNDGIGFLTAGEDGFVKVWSRSGMLRSTVVTSENSVYAACWSPDNQSIAYTQGKCVVVKQLAPNTKPLRWKAHEGLVLCLAWSVASELLVSGGEDCRYRVWDGQGRQIFSSGLHDNHITAIAWTAAGDLFAVASYNTLRLCDYCGWSRSLEKPDTGSIYKLAWSNDGSQLAGACANGHVLFTHVVERHVHYQNISASLSEKKLVRVNNVLDDTTESLEFPERVIHMAMRYSHLVVTTPSQCYIYNTSNWNTPVIFDLNDGSVSLLEMCEKHMLLVEKSTVGVYNYQGRQIVSPKWPNMRLDGLRQSHVTISSDTLAVRDTADQKSVHIIDLGNNRNTSDSTTTIHHSVQIIQIALDQWGTVSARTLAILDKARDLYIVQVRSSNKTFSKLGRKIESFRWNSNTSIIAAIQDAQLIVWYCPQASFNAKLLNLCSMQYGGSELGRAPRISDFVGNSVAIRRGDGSLLNIPISPFPEILYRFIDDGKWSDALNMCRNVNDVTLWACMAVIATHAMSDAIDIAEEAFSNINHHEKVFYIQHIKTLPSKAEQRAHMALLGGRIQEAESILLHNGMVFQAIYINITMHNWIRALDLAIKHKSHVDSVLYLRQKYLDTLGKSENNNKFATIKDTIQLDEQKVEQKIMLELQKRKKSID